MTAYKEMLDSSKQAIRLMEQASIGHDLMALLVKDIEKEKFDDFDQYFDLSHAIHKAF
jgi:hypothetical protein